jgi:Flp pilus assembly protein protease CpaA
MSTAAAAAAAAPMMTGIGDEVVLFLISLVLGGVLFLAWLSTNVRERPRVEAVLVQQVRPGECKN